MANEARNLSASFATGGISDLPELFRSTKRSLKGARRDLAVRRGRGHRIFPFVPFDERGNPLAVPREGSGAAKYVRGLLARDPRALSEAERKFIMPFHRAIRRHMFYSDIAGLTMTEEAKAVIAGRRLPRVHENPAVMKAMLRQARTSGRKIGT